MTAILALLPQLYPLIRDGIGDVKALIAYVKSVRGAAMRTNVWTAEQETKFLEALLSHVSDPAYQPDSK